MTRPNPFPPNKAKSTDDASKRKQAPFDFSGQNADGDDLSDLDLRHVNFKGASLVGALFEQSNLSGVNLSGADLSGANFRNADLSGANLSAANIDGVDFSSADLQGARLLSIERAHEMANFENANLTGSLSSDTEFIAVAKALSDPNGPTLPDVEFAHLTGVPEYRFRLTAAQKSGYHRELTDILARHGVGAFRIAPAISSDKKHLTVCCGGPTRARMRGFEELTGAAEWRWRGVEKWLPVTPRGVAHVRNSLIGYMLAQVVVLFFESRADYDAWLDDGVEAAFLELTQPANRAKRFAVICPDALPLGELRRLTGAGVLTDSLNLSAALDRLGGHHYSPIVEGMVLIPSGMSGGVPNSKPFLLSQGQLTVDRGFDARLILTLNWNKMLEISNKLSPPDSKCYTNVSTWWRDVEWDRACTGFRMPTSAEWGFAARAFSALRYSGSDSAEDVAWYYNNTVTQVHDHSIASWRPCGLLKPNGFGLYDMSGNVEEWCWDLFNPEGGNHRVCRGGSFLDRDAERLRVREVHNFTPHSIREPSSIGGRLARSLA